MQPQWYRIADGVPPLNIPVWVEWGGRFFVAKRYPNVRQRNRIRWMIETDRGLVAFPPRSLAKRLGDHPRLWRPLDARRWPYALPDPVSPPGTPWVHPEAKDPGYSAQDGWWRDATQVSYSPGGAVPKSEAEARVLRALCTGRALSVQKPEMRSNADVFVSIAAPAASLFLSDGDIDLLRCDWRPRFEPTGYDHDDFLIASAWFQSLHPVPVGIKRRTKKFNRLQSVLLLRSLDPPWTWASIGDKWGISGERARQIYQDAIDKVWAAANGKGASLPARPRPRPPAIEDYHCG